MEKTLGKMIDKLFTMRSARNALQHKVDDITSQLELQKDEIIKMMKDQNLDKASGKMASAFLEVAIRPSVDNKDLFLKWVFKNKKFEFIASKVNTAAVKEMLDQKNKVPPGVTVFSQEMINLRKL